MEFSYLFGNPKKGKKKAKKSAKKKVSVKKHGKKKPAKKAKKKVSSKKKVGKKKFGKKKVSKKVHAKKISGKKKYTKKVSGKRKVSRKKGKKNPEARTLSSGKKTLAFTKNEIKRVYSLSDSAMKSLKKLKELHVCEKNVGAKKRQADSIKRLESAIGKLDTMKKYVDTANVDSASTSGKVTSSKRVSDARYDMAIKDAIKAMKSAKHIHIAPKLKSKSASKNKRPKKGSAEAKEWAKKMQEARKAKGTKKKSKAKSKSKAKTAKKVKSKKKSVSSFIKSKMVKGGAKKSKAKKSKAKKSKAKKSTKGKSQKHQKHSKPQKKLPVFSLKSLMNKLPLPSKKGKTRNFFIGKKKFKIVKLNPSGGNMEVESLAKHKMVNKAYNALNKISNMAAKHEFLEVSGMAASAALMGVVDRALLNAPAIGGVYNTMRSYGGVGMASYLSGLAVAIATEMGAKKLSGEGKVAMEALHQISRGVISAGIVNMWQTLLAPSMGVAGLVQTKNMNGLVQTMNGADFGRLIETKNMNGLVQTMNGADFGRYGNLNSTNADFSGLVQTMNGADFEGFNDDGYYDNNDDYDDYDCQNYSNTAYDIKSVVDDQSANSMNDYEVSEVLSGIDFE